METVPEFIFLGSKLTADGDCSLEIKRHLLLGGKTMTNLENVLQSRVITLRKIHIVKAMLFPVSHVWMWEFDHKEGWILKTWCLCTVVFSSVQFSRSVVSWLCNHVNCSTPGLPVYHQLPEFTQTCVHWVGDAIQPSHPLSSPSPPTFNLSQHQSFQMSQFFTSGGQSIRVSTSASVRPKNIQDCGVGEDFWESLWL